MGGGVLRRTEGLSQAALGERVGIGRVGITKLEQGHRPITVQEAQALAHALGVSLMYLLGESQPEADEEGVELRFEVTVKLLPSREEKAEPTAEEIRQMIENPPPGEPYDEKVKRVFGKDTKIDKTSQKASRSPKVSTRRQKA